nr:immunoglobulin light chain junction region [Macaca mulatta]MOW07944.1 immunoglobulin light chain junction region [Macaca mulatta]MOW08174.1 immunoglobulin light chain junction region [Macaca mulatta]MOW08343.1 immunoglobulin light chain junction region [Macaca mulatta]MOW08490.1 immunoglobulin light chain junction region [Macaca mulatta]
CQKYIAAPLTF